MGIDFSHCNAHWSYGNFHNFRRKLASQIGINLDLMDGFYMDEHFCRKEGISWSGVDDPIKILLNHSDCDGFLTPRECRKVYPRLLDIVKNWDDDDDKMMAINLANGMKKACRRFQKLWFH